MTISRPSSQGVRNSGSDYPYFRSMWRRIVVRLWLAAFFPILVIGGALYWFSVSSWQWIGLACCAAAILITTAVLLISNDLIHRLETKRRSLRNLDRQLRRTSYMSTAMELSLGFFNEVKDTLANIDSAAAVLTEEPDAKDHPHLMAGMAEIREEVHRGRRSIDRLIGYIQQEPPVIREVDLHQVIDDLLDILGRSFHFRQIEVIREYQADSAVVRSDRFKLRQVFQNLVLNAIDALDKNGRMVISSRQTDGQITIAIEDNGPGITEADLPHIFEPLWTTRDKGLGLGLPICRDILDRLGGRIHVAAALGQGTIVTVTLPRQFIVRSGEGLEQQTKPFF